jgi:hypothetical protein
MSACEKATRRIQQDCRRIESGEPRRLRRRPPRGNRIWAKHHNRLSPPAEVGDELEVAENAWPARADI